MKSVEIIPLKKPVSASVEIPGSKSYTNRALIIAALTKGRVIIKNPLFSDDTKAMIACLKSLGIKIKVLEDQIVVEGSVNDVTKKEYKLNANLSGTTIRFILALCCLVPGIKILSGESGLNKRPIKDLVEGLKQLGAEIEYLKKTGFPPLKITSSKLHSGTMNLSGKTSSQYLSAILMIAPLVGSLKIKVEGEQISKPYIDMTIDIMSKFSVQIDNKNYREYNISSNKGYQAAEYIVEGDYSSAGYFFAIAALTNSKLTIKNLNPDSKQADLEFVEILKNSSAKIDMERCPDQVQTMSVLAAFENRVTTISGVSSLRVKETERVKALQKELKKMGIKTKSTKNVLTIYGGNPHGAEINTYGDHRMAMSFAVAGTKIPGIKINAPMVVSKTFPDFWQKLEQIGVELKWH